MNEILKLVNEISELAYPTYKLIEILSSIERDVLELVLISNGTLTIDKIKTTVYEYAKTGKYELGLVKLDFGGFFERDVNGLALLDATLLDGTVVRVNENLEYTDANGNVIVLNEMDISKLDPVVTANLNQPLYELFLELYHSIFNAYVDMNQIHSFRIYVKTVLTEIEKDPNLIDKYLIELKTIKQSLEVE